jgi:hypothetical protein
MFPSIYGSTENSCCDVTKLCREQAEIIKNHDNENVRNIGEGEARHRNCKRLKHGGDHVYDSSSV